MVRLTSVAIGLLLAGCSAVEISPKEHPRSELPEPQFTATTFWYSNNKSVPKRRLLRAAEKKCRVPSQLPESPLQSQGPYGIHGSWFLDFSCSRNLQSATTE